MNRGTRFVTGLKNRSCSHCCCSWRTLTKVWLTHSNPPGAGLYETVVKWLITNPPDGLWDIIKVPGVTLLGLFEMRLCRVIMHNNAKPRPVRNPISSWCCWFFSCDNENAKNIIPTKITVCLVCFFFNAQTHTSCRYVKLPVAQDCQRLFFFLLHRCSAPHILWICTFHTAILQGNHAMSPLLRNYKMEPKIEAQTTCFCPKCNTRSQEW